ncbi:MAG: glycoside hydrolase family 18 protein, partial [Limisphaerales bacterium]
MLPSLNRSEWLRARTHALRGSLHAMGIVLGLACSVLDSVPCYGQLWTTGYYPGYRQSYLPPSAIDFDALTHIIHFSLVPNTDGTLNYSANGITAARSADLLARAHAAGRRVLVCVGGADSQTGFRGATSSVYLASFVSNLVSFVSVRGYDGVDVDWEPLDAADISQFTDLISALRSGLKAQSQQSLLSAAAASQPELFAALQDDFDQINLMTYDLAGPWPGWVTWFNSPVFDGSYRFPSTGGLVPSLDGMVRDFLAAGVDSRKIGIGIAFYGNVWAGGAGTSTGGAALPRQEWTSAPTTSQIAFFDLMANYYQSNLYHWDTNAQAAYLSIDPAGSANDKFISYDDEHTCQANVSYARNQALGGVMIWELGEGYRPSEPSGRQAPLLEAIRQSMDTPRLAVPRVNG